MCRYILRAMPSTGGTVKVRISTVQLYNLRPVLRLQAITWTSVTGQQQELLASDG